MVAFIASLLTAALATTTTAASLGSQHCHAPNQFGKHADVLSRVLEFGAQLTCYKHDEMMAAGDSPIKQFVTGANVQPKYHYEISWVDGCEGDSQSVQTPVDGATCESLFIGSWTNCKRNRCIFLGGPDANVDTQAITMETVAGSTLDV